MLENSPQNKEQKELVEDVLLFDEKYLKKIVKSLEASNTDLYITSNRDGQSVNVKLLTAAGLTYNFIPHDDSGAICTTLYTKKSRKSYQNRNNMSWILQRISTFTTNTKENDKNASKMKFFEKLSLTDLYRKDSDIARPELLPQAKCLFGEKQVTTKDFLV